MTTYWFVYTDITLFGNEESTYVMPDFMTYDDCTVRHTYSQDKWISPDYLTLLEMVRAFHSIVVLTGKNLSINFYIGIAMSINGSPFTHAQYISVGRELYQRYANGKAKRKLAREEAAMT